MTQEDQQNRYLAWTDCLNVREVGGYPTEDGKRIRWRTLVRADNLHRLTPEGESALCDYGVCTIIDLRMERELERHPNPFAAQQGTDDRPRYVNLPMHDPATIEAMDAASTMQEDYIIILEANKPRVAAIIKAVAEALEKGGVLVHCHGGKDRTGIVVALLLSLAGVPRRMIAEDYAISEAQLEPAYSAWLEEQAQVQGQPVERPRWMYSRPETMQGTLEHLDQKYGGVEGYLKAIGVPQGDIDRIREHLICSAEAGGS